MNPASNDLSITLRDIHTPDGVSWWPPAAGWWIVIAVLAIAAAMLFWLWWRHRRPPLLQTLAQREFDTIMAPGFGDSFARFVALNTLLRRLARACPGDEAWQTDTTGQWLDGLSRWAGLASCPQALIAQVAREPFQPSREVDVEPLMAQARAIIQALPAVRANLRLGGLRRAG